MGAAFHRCLGVCAAICNRDANFVRVQAAAISDALGEHCVEVRGRGLMRGIKLAPPLTAAAFMAHCRRHRLLIVGTDDPQIVRVLPHLLVDDGDIATAAKLMRAAARDALLELSSAAKSS